MSNWPSSEVTWEVRIDGRGMANHHLFFQWRQLPDNVVIPQHALKTTSRQNRTGLLSAAHFKVFLGWQGICDDCLLPDEIVQRIIV